jgi:hypothetical protein
MKAETIHDHPVEQIQAYCDQFLAEYRRHLDSTDFPLTEERLINFYWLFYGKLNAIRSIFFDGYLYESQAKEQLDRIYDEYLEKLRNQPDDSGRPSAGASGAAVGQGDKPSHLHPQCPSNDICDVWPQTCECNQPVPDDAYTVEHIQPDPDACPDCFGTGLDFTHTADFCHCLICKITHQPGNRASSAGPLKPIIV